MRNTYEYLTDKKFLKEIIHSHVVTYFVKITVLDWQERPIQDIQGEVITASFNIDGQSNIRRTGNLSVLIDNEVAQAESIKRLITINKKINVEIGYLNDTDQYLNYPIIWFPLGLYVITNKSISHSISDLTLNLQISDKMCLLNGQCGGTISAATVFDNYSSIDENGQQVIVRPTIYQIIQQLVNHFGGQQLGKIIISDLDTRVKQVMKWTNAEPLYFVQKNGQYEATMDVQYYKKLLDGNWVDVLGAPFEYGMDVGYIYTDFTYPGELICDAGAAVADILDEIVETLGNYEYFYDVDGNFIFQQIKNYLNNSQTKYITDALNNNIPVPDYIANLYEYGSPLPDDYLLDMTKGKTVFEFENSDLIQSYDNSPSFESIKNDFVIWGLKPQTDESEIPIRYHLAIDKKPEVGNIYKVFKYEDPEDGLTKYHTPIEYTSRAAFPPTGVVGMFYYDQAGRGIYKWEKDDSNVYSYTMLNTEIINVKTQDWRSELYFQGVAAQPYGTESNYYYTELKNEWPKIYELVKQDDGYYIDQMREDVEKHPENVDFFLDIIEPTSKLEQLQVSNIGRRTQVLNEQKNVNCIFEPQIPDIIILPAYASNKSSQMGKMRQQAENRGQTWFQVKNSIYQNLEIGGSFNSAYQTIRQLLHQYTSYNESVSISCLPIYFLEPNTRIKIQDIESDIHGEYMIDSMSFGLDQNSTMSINCTRALEKI